jgi:hypothetical protein
LIELTRTSNTSYCGRTEIIETMWHIFPINQQ